MQQDKSTKKTEQIGKAVLSEDQLSISITEVIKFRTHKNRKIEQKQ